MNAEENTMATTDSSPRKHPNLVRTSLLVGIPALVLAVCCIVFFTVASPVLSVRSEWKQAARDVASAQDTLIASTEIVKKLDIISNPSFVIFLDAQVTDAQELLSLTPQIPSSTQAIRDSIATLEEDKLIIQAMTTRLDDSVSWILSDMRDSMDIDASMCTQTDPVEAAACMSAVYFRDHYTSDVSDCTQSDPVEALACMITAVVKDDGTDVSSCTQTDPFDVIACLKDLVAGNQPTSNKTTSPEPTTSPSPSRYSSPSPSPSLSPQTQISWLVMDDYIKHVLGEEDSTVTGMRQLSGDRYIAWTKVTVNGSSVTADACILPWGMALSTPTCTDGAQLSTATGTRVGDSAPVSSSEFTAVIKFKDSSSDAPVIDIQVPVLAGSNTGYVNPSGHQ